jgi:nucleotide-binding universal stress UspA family protein
VFMRVRQRDVIWLWRAGNSELSGCYLSAVVAGRDKYGATMSMSASKTKAIDEVEEQGRSAAPRTVIVGVDGSETATEAARCAARLAAASDVSLTLVIAHPGGRSVHVHAGGDSWDVSGESSARSTARRVASSLGSVVDQVHIVEGVGKPAEVLVEQAELLDAGVIWLGRACNRHSLRCSYQRQSLVVTNKEQP